MRSRNRRGIPKKKSCSLNPLPGSKSNTAAREIEFQYASQKVGKIDDKNEDLSKSVNSFDFGAIFLPRLGQDLSRNVGLMSVYAF